MKKIAIYILVTMLACMSFLGCGNNDTRDKIRLSEVTHSIFYAPLYIAINKGFFEEENIKIELSNAGGADKVMTAIASKSADIGLMGPEATIYVNAEGKIDYPIIFGQLTKRDGSFLVGRKNEPDFDWSNLTGKRVLAGRPGGVPAMTLQYVCNNKGLYNNSNINLDTSVAFDMMAPVFESDKTVDYTTLFEPTASAFVEAGKGYIVASVGEESGEVPYTAFSASKSYLTENKELVVRFLKALIKAYNYMVSSDVSDVADALQNSFTTTDKASIINVINSYIKIGAWSSTPVMMKNDFDRLQDIMENAESLTARADFDKIVDNSYAAEALTAVNG